MLQGRWAETFLIPLSHARCRQDGPLHRGGDLLSIGPLLGHRSISKFAMELANRLLNDFCFNLVDHISPNLILDHAFIRLTRRRYATAGCRGKHAELKSKWGRWFIDWLDICCNCLLSRSLRRVMVGNQAPVPLLLYPHPGKASVAGNRLAFVLPNHC